MGKNIRVVFRPLGENMKRVVTKEGSKQVGNFVSVGIQSLILSPFMSQDSYNKKLNKQLEKISNITISASITQLVEFIKITKKFSQGFKDTDLETEAIIKSIPVLRPYYREVYYHVKEVRGKLGLK